MKKLLIDYDICVLPLHADENLEEIWGETNAVRGVRWTGFEIDCHEKLTAESH